MFLLAGKGVRRLWGEADAYVGLGGVGAVRAMGKRRRSSEQGPGLVLLARRPGCDTATASCVACDDSAAVWSATGFVINTSQNIPEHRSIPRLLLGTCRACRGLLERTTRLLNSLIRWRQRRWESEERWTQLEAGKKGETETKRGPVMALTRAIELCGAIFAMGTRGEVFWCARPPWMSPDFQISRQRLCAEGHLLLAQAK